MSNCSICNHHNRPTARFCANCRAPLILQNKYRIARLLGRGGYGAVYQAEHTGLGGALYAIKELYPDPTATPEQQQAASEQFRLEASILAKLNHPALPKVMDFFSEGNRDYLVMEYVEGETLEEQLTRNRAPLPEAQVLAWAQELCDVLTYLHTRQPSPVIHRDVKPSNIKITPDGKLKLIDFGIAKLLVAGAGTKGAARAVSPHYSPMEQYGKGTDARSDIYALGVTLYELLTNRLPPEAPDRTSEPVISPLVVNPALAPHATALVLKAMAEKPAERFQSAVEMKQALTASAKPAQPTTPIYQQPVAAQQPAPYTTPVPAHTPSQGAYVTKSGSGGWTWLAILLVVGGALLFGVQEVSRQQAAATATAEANATATAEARATATAQAASFAANTLAQRASRIFGPFEGRLEHVVSDNISVRSSNVTVRDFVIEARFFNPYGVSEHAWDYGFLFRDTGGNKQYRLVVSSNSRWDLFLVDGDPNVAALEYGYVENFDITVNGSNRIRLVAKDTSVYFFVNDKYVATLNVSKKLDSGDIYVATGIYGGHTINGKFTRYEGFTVWSLQ